MDKSQLIADAIDALRELGVGKDQQNDRSAMTLLAQIGRASRRERVSEAV